MGDFAIANVPPGRLNALVKNLMIQMDIMDPLEAVRRINSGEWVVSRSTRQWREKDGVIYFIVQSDGIIGSEWVVRLEKKGLCVLSDIKKILYSKDFRPTLGNTTRVAVLKGQLLENRNCVTGEIVIKEACLEASARNFTNPSVEVACLIWDAALNGEFDFISLPQMVIMHEPFSDLDEDATDSEDLPDGTVLFKDADLWLTPQTIRSDGIRWGPSSRRLRDYGFAFVATQSAV